MMLFSNNKYIALLCALFLSLFVATELKAQDTEQILSFHSDIKIEQLEQVLITETIRINVTGESIKEGIVRTLPKYIETSDEEKTLLKITPISVTRDRQDETFSVSENEDFVDIHIGDESYVLPPAIYEYCIVYKVSYNIYSSANKNFIDWEITGSKWAFPIDSVSATLHIPQGYEILNNWCFTNLSNIADDCDYNVEGDSIVYFECTTELDKGDNFAISTEFGLPNIQEDTSISGIIFSFLKKWDQLFLNLPFGLFVVLTIFLYRYIQSIDKRSAKIPKNISLTETPPQNLSAAELRYIYKGNLDPRALGSSLLSLARHGAIIITEEEDGLICLTKRETSIALPSEEQILVENLFIENNDTIYLENSISSHLRQVSNLWKKDIVERLKISDYYLDKKFIVNKVRKVSAAIMTAWAFILFAFTNFQSNDFARSMFALLLSGVFVIMCNSKLKKTLSSKKIFKSILCIFTIFALSILLLLAVLLIIKPLSLENVWTVLFYTIVIIFNLKFNDKYTARTQKGAEEIAKIEGFRMYMKMPKKAQSHSSKYIIEEYDKMFPYAVALDLEKAWTEKFADILDICNYQPAWYDGKTYNSISDFASSFTTSLIASLYISNIKFVVEENSFLKNDRR